ncbi:GNAT family N-acetyltransferase [Leucobacter sp. CSA1]|uniref:GNAT family N-acetyltransferase n=1 Tax=Leucobacter chromiisoli TaxID=2796471 RepID=A0A934Q8Z9_9MICO|nr:GNAT family N-acetyltransferase [Leucobacter chromiisoli]MBK0419326.1 GNAT family N-acetyltransferase [Leucobacter chromiisoli]
MTQFDARTVPADQTSRAALEPAGLDYRLVDAADTTALDGLSRAVARGFLESEPTEEVLLAGRPAQETRRLVGVYDGENPRVEMPVATVGSWVAPLTVPGGELPMWAVSEVTVAPTHRRRGIARAMLEGELRAAAGAGIPIAGLTASEATIYGRYGFGQATWETRWTVDTRRAGWAGPEPEGRLHPLDRELLAAALGELHERTRASRAGDIAGWTRRWQQIAGTDPGEPHGRSVRGVRYVDAEGALRGALAYRVVESEVDWTRSRLEIRHMIGETAEARAALWRFALQHDLVGTVEAGMRPADDPLPWLLADSRAAVPTVQDHGWLRILDVPRVFAARTAAAPLSVVLRVGDRLGFAEGVWRLETTDDGRFRATPAAGAEAELELGAGELSSLYLGGVSARSLAEAGRVRGDLAAAARLDEALRLERAPHLSIMY